MKAIILKEPGTVENLLVSEVPVPAIKEGEVLIQAKSISINPVDIKTRKGNGVYGKINEESPIILGWDVSGVVTESKSELFKKGDKVFGMVNFPGHGKAYAEYVAAPASQLALIPDTISFDEAAAATLTALTAWQALVTNAKIKAGDKVLIHAASGGVGHFAVQIAKYFGAHVIGTSSAENKDFVLSLGADEHLDYKAQRFEEVVKDMDFVLDTIGGENIDRSLEIIRPGGTLISIPSGLNDLLVEKAKAKNIDGYFIMVQSSGEDMKIIADLLEKGTLKAHVSKTFSFEKLADAHLYVETARSVGKVIVKVSE